MYGRNTCSLINPLPVFFPPPPPFNPPAPVPSSSPLSPNLQLPCPHHPHCLRAFKYRDTLVFHVRVDHSGDWGTRGGVAGVSCGEGGSGVGLSNELKAFEAPQKSGEEGSRVGLSDELKGWEKKGKRARRGAVGRNGGKEADFVGGKEGEWGEEREGKRKGEETGEERKGEERNEEGRREEGDEGNWGGNTRDEVEGVTTPLVREASVVRVSACNRPIGTRVTSFLCLPVHLSLSSILFSCTGRSCRSCVRMQSPYRHSSHFFPLPACASVPVLNSLQLHRSSFVCPQADCNKAFASGYKLRRHLIVHNPNAPRHPCSLRFSPCPPITSTHALSTSLPAPQSPAPMLSPLLSLPPNHQHPCSLHPPPCFPQLPAPMPSSPLVSDIHAPRLHGVACKEAAFGFGEEGEWGEWGEAAACKEAALQRFQGVF
ncbi:unnamed protein product, partial [Closterium sp. NIES-65]